MVRTAGAKIPKIIHYCWFGENPISKEAKMHLKTWKKKCPDYKIQLWNEDNFDVGKYRYTQEAYKAKKWAFVSDVCRLEKIHEIGGIYIDINTDALKSFDDLLDNELFIGFEQDNRIAAGIFGARKGHPIIKDVLKRYKKESLYRPNGKINFATINDRFEPELLKRGLVKNNALQRKRNFTVYPKEYFNPRYWNSPDQDPITKNTYTVHYYGASWHDDDTRSLFNKLTSADQPLVSVVIPVYNVEKYIGQCVDSVLGQTYKNLEVILVDDKTPDGSGKLADNYAKQDSRVKVIHKPKNEGLNMARATGFEQCSGEYVTFVDSDDLLVSDCIETAIKEIYQNETDFVKFNFAKFKDRKTLTELQKSVSGQQVEKRAVVKGKRDLYKTRFVNQVVGISAVCVWGGLYATKAVRKMDWQESNYRINEDNFWTLSFFAQVNSGTYISKVGYLYRSDDAYQGVLSKAVTGNSHNGRPVGYLEFVKEYFDRFRFYNKKYKLELDNDIDLLESWTWIDRLSTLTKNDKLSAENNLDYLPIALRYMVQQYEDKKALNNTRKEEIKKLLAENEKLRRDIKSFHSIKRSTRLLLGNTKRKIKGFIGKKV